MCGCRSCHLEQQRHLVLRCFAESLFEVTSTCMCLLIIFQNRAFQVLHAFYNIVSSVLHFEPLHCHSLCKEGALCTPSSFAPIFYPKSWFACMSQSFESFIFVYENISNKFLTLSENHITYKVCIE